MKRIGGNWTDLRRALKNYIEVDFHHDAPREIPYWEAMEDVRRTALQALKDAHVNGNDYVLFLHGASTSRLGATTARSQVRGLIRSKDATPYVVRSQCLQHETVFVAAIRKSEG